MATAIFEFVDGTEEHVTVGGRRYRELIEDGHTPTGSVPEPNGISDQLEAYLGGRFTPHRPRAEAVPPLSQTILAPVMGTVPTFATSGPGGASPINAGSPTAIPYNTTKVTRLGCVPTVVNQLGTDYHQNASNAAWTPAAWAVEFDYYGDDFAIRFRNATGNSSRFWVFVDGQPATATPQLSTANSGGSLFYYRVTFASVALRRVRVYMSQADFGGIDVKPTHTVSPTPRRHPRLAVYGDSFIEGTGANSQLESMGYTVGRILNWETFAAGQGGTGYTQASVNPKKNYADATRLAQLAATEADYIMVYGSTNDDAGTSPAVGTAAASVYSQLATLAPASRLIVVGPASLSSSPSATRLTNRDAIKAAALAAPNVMGFVDPLAASGFWVTGNGNSGSPNGSGNADLFTNSGANAGHPTQAGHDYYARRIVQGIVDILRAA